MELFPEKEKLYYTIGEVKDITGIESHVLRYWETEFAMFKPRKSRNGQRAYTKKDIEMALDIKRLLYDEKFTIKGAKNKLKVIAQERKNSLVQDNKFNDVKQQQMVFGEIEENIQASAAEKDFLIELRKKLLKISSLL